MGMLTTSQGLQRPDMQASESCRKPTVALSGVARKRAWSYVVGLGSAGWQCVGS